MMKYESNKVFTAVLSVMSLMITLFAYIFGGISGWINEKMLVNKKLVIQPDTLQFAFEFNFLTYTAVVIAALAATIRIASLRKLNYEREREKIFFIYAHEDLKVAKSLSNKLKDAGFNTWLDVEQIMPGQIWEKAVIQGIEESVVALVLVSENIEKKGFVHQELKVALKALQQRNEGISPVIPIRLDDSPVPEQKNLGFNRQFDIVKHRA